jgi:hypothetical protein
MYYNKYMEQDTIEILLLLSNIAKKTSLKKTFKWIFIGFSMFFIGMLFFIVLYDALTGATSQTPAEYCARYGFLSTPDC